MKLSLSEQLILGILAERDRHGYDIEKVITDRGMRKWTDIGFSSIYYVLERLEVKGLVASANTQAKAKKQYSITDSGIATLANETKQLVATRQPSNTHFMAGLATSDLIDVKDFIASLEKRRAELAADSKALEDTQREAQHIQQSARRLFSLSKAHVDAELDWINKELGKVTS